MKTKPFKFYFKGGEITVRAFSENEAKILAQAKAIKNGWDYEIQDEPPMTKEQARQYIRNVLENWEAFCNDHKRFVTALKVLVNEGVEE